MIYKQKVNTQHGLTILLCEFSNFRYLNPPNYWVACALESRELMALCLKKLKNLSKVKLIDANFVWTEPHSKRIKVCVTMDIHQNFSTCGAKRSEFFWANWEKEANRQPF